MNPWYYAFAAAVALMWLIAVPADKDALAVVLAATLLSGVLVDHWTCHITAIWKLIIPGTVETITVVALLCTPFTKTALNQVLLVTVAWCAHYLCFTDLIYRTDVVYSGYEVILGAIAIAQLLVCHDTYLHHFRRLGRWCREFGAGDAGGVRAPGVSSAVLRDPGARRV